jgi:3-oxoacyl-[acyl-carrier-protein] synthase II
MERRIVISGIGVITPIGIGKESFWRSVINGKSKVTDIRDPHLLDLKVCKGFLIEDFECQQVVSSGNANKLGRGARLGLASAKFAVEDSGLDFNIVDPGRVGVSVGTTLGESQAMEKAAYQSLFKNEAECGDVEIFYRCCPTNLAACIAEEFRLTGPTILIPTACSAGNYAISHAFDLIRTGRADIMIAGGAEPFSKVLHIGFARMMLLAPERCQPFDRERKGLLVSEGAGFLVLEDYVHAKKRSANIYGEILGYGLSCDAYHMAAPEPEGRGAAEALQGALQSAKLNPEDIQYISAHGTGTRSNDLVETKAVKRVFGPLAKGIPISSIKSMIGHTMGAAGAIEAVLCALVLQRQVVPPTINYLEPDPLCDLDYVPNQARDLPVSKVISNAYGFCGNNGSVVFASC